MVTCPRHVHDTPPQVLLPDGEEAAPPQDEGEMALPMAGLHLRLEDEWADTPARQGDRVHVIGSLRGCGCGGALHWSCGVLSRWREMSRDEPRSAEMSRDQPR